jgi:PAS domain S-box-containing protein
MGIAAELLGRHLNVGRCGYGEVDESGNFFSVEREWTDGVMPSLAGRLRLDDFGPELIQECRNGRVVRLDDPLADARTKNAVAPYASIGGLRAGIAAPLVKQGRFVAALYVHQTTPRRWMDGEAELVRDVAERTWSAVERLRAEAQSRAREVQFRQLAEAMPNHVWTSKPDGLLDWFNRRVYEFSGAKTGELDGQGWASIVHPDDVAAAAERWGVALERGESYETEFRLRRFDGVFRWHIARAIPIRGATGKIERWIGTNTDIEDQKTAMRDLADLNASLESRVEERSRALLSAEEALRQSQKLEALGQLTGGVAHDFNNLLTGIISALALTRRRIDSGRFHEIGPFMDAASGAAHKAASLIQRLLAFARRQPLDTKDCDINRLVLGMDDLLRQTLGEGIELSTLLGNDVWPALADANQFENALLNLAINARDAMPDGGRLIIATSNLALSRDIAAVDGSMPPGEYVVVSVSDTGTGMSADVLAKAIDLFFTTKPVGQGTGLGLSMIYGFMKQSEGHLRLNSEIDKGTTVELCFKRSAGTDERTVPDLRPVPPPRKVSARRS